MVSRYLPAAVIAAAIAALIVVALGQLGTAKGASRTETQIVTASDGVVQSTVTGTGSVEPVTEEDVDFQTSGTLSHVDVKDGEYVQKGQLLATLNDTTASLTLQQAREALTEAKATLTDDENSLSGSSSSSTGTSDTVNQSGAASEDVSYSPPSGTTSTVTTTTATAPTTTTVPTSTATTTTPAGTATTTTPAGTGTTGTRGGTGATTTPSSGSTGSTGSTGTTGTTGTSGTTGTTGTSSSTGTRGSTGTSGTTGTGGSSSTVTAATVDGDKLQVDEDEQTVKEDQQALDETRLRAPVSGTITSLESIVPGDSVASGSSSGASGSSSTSTTESTGLGASSAGSSSSSADSSSSSTGSSSAFAVIDTLKHLSMTVSFTEADINKLKVGQAAVVTLDAISGLELAAKVTSVSSIGTTTNSVTSYDATVTLDQYDSRVKPGMSASAEVIIKQARGVTVPSAAVTGTETLATVKEDVNGKQTTKKVIVGLRGDSRDLIVSGLSSGAELVETESLPALGSSASTSNSSSSSAASGFAGRRAFGGGSFGGGGFGGGGFGGGGGAP